jgi:cytochrome c-type biogenesis protein CcsB
VAHRSAVFGFPIWTFAVIAGAIWAESAWGRFWGWDPKETWAFIAWVVYAAYLHARTTAGWRGRPAAWVNVVGLAVMIFNLLFVNLVSTGLHSYAGVS